MRKGFTLIEVNLAMLIMAMGVLAIVGLYALGYRENRQSREDVEASALADHVISPLVMAITHTNQKWSVFKKPFQYPADGWAGYFDNEGVVSADPDGMAQTAFSQAMGSWLQADSLTPSVETKFPLPAKSEGDNSARSLSCGLVIYHRENSPIVRIAFRATKQPGTLLAMPLFYTEAVFQGDPNQ